MTVGSAIQKSERRKDSKTGDMYVALLRFETLTRTLAGACRKL